jgi:hypothetical protein
MPHSWLSWLLATITRETAMTNDKEAMNCLEAGGAKSSSVLARHSVLDTESSRGLWIPAFAGMTSSKQTAGDVPSRI